MPSKPTAAPARENFARSFSTFVNTQHCTLPVWDEAQVAQENWGGPLGLSAAGSSGGGDAGKDGKSNPGKSKPVQGSNATSAAAPEAHFEDEATTSGVSAFISACRPPARHTKAAAGEEGGAGAAVEEVVWQSPTDVFRPFRPVVHRNVTPFVHPYAAADALTPLEAKAEKARCRAQSVTPPPAVSNSASHRRSGGGARQSDTASTVTESFHEFYPEAITVLETFNHEEREHWTHCTPTEAVRCYRALPALMQPYDGALVAGCAETPAEACESRYSTGLRHKLKQAEQLAALAEAPPFLMSAFNSALVAVEQAQRFVPPGFYLWELVYPHAPGTCHPVYNPFGKYAVKLFVEGAYRKVIVDDSLPVDVLGRPLLSTTSRKEMWPCLLVKALVKALGPVSGVRALTSAPELIVTALMGDWVPQYLSPQKDAVITTAQLLLYQRQLAGLETLDEPFVKEALEAGGISTEADVAGSDAKDSKGNPGDRKSMLTQGQRKASPVQRASGGAEKRRMSRTSNRTAVVLSELDEDEPLKPLRATEYCAPTVDEPLPQQPFYVCALHTSAPRVANTSDGVAAPHALGSGAQLYTVRAMRPFRNTVALLLHTTPRVTMIESIFDKEKNADDVCALRQWGDGQSILKLSCEQESLLSSGILVSAGHDADASNRVARPSDAKHGTIDMIIMDSERSSSVTSCWLTLEEFMSRMEVVIVWRKLTGRYAHAVSVSGESLLQKQGAALMSSAAALTDSATTPSARKNLSAARRGDASAPPATAPGGGTHFITAAPPPVSLWWKITTERAIEAVMVVSCPAHTDDAGSSSVPVKSVPANVSAAGSSRTIAPMDASVSAETQAEKSRMDAEQERQVHFSHFQWDRAEPLNRISTLTYRNDTLSSTVLRFRPGVHLIRVDVHNAQGLDKLCFLSDAVMEVQLDQSHDAARDGFACVTDAGSYPAIYARETETVWLKRVFSVSVPTCVTLLLSTLDPTEDVAAHRQVYTLANRSLATAAGGKGAGSHGKAAPGARGAPQGAVAGGAPRKPSAVGSGNISCSTDTKRRGDAHLPPDVVESGGETVASPIEHAASILRFTSLLLVNLDDPDNSCVGTAGRLVKLNLEPNEKGYLIMAYSKVPAQSATSAVQEGCLHSDTDVDTGLSPQLQSPVESTSEENAPPPTFLIPGQSLSPAVVNSPPLFPEGLWKLTLRSDVELQSFDVVTHDLNSITVEADLPHGGSPLLFRRTCTVTETTHVSIVARLWSPMPMPYVVRVMRTPAAVTTTATSTSPRAVRPSNNTSVAAAADWMSTDLSNALSGVASPVASGVGSRTGMLVVYESPLTHDRLFAANVLLSCATEVASKTSKGQTTSGMGGGGGGGGSAGPTTYVIEASVTGEDAAKWNEQCRQLQEDVFREFREAAEEQAASMHQRDMEEYQCDPGAFLQRSREILAQRLQIAAEAAEKAVSRSTNTGNSATLGPRRASSARRHSHRASGGSDGLLKDTRRQSSFMTQSDPTYENTIRYRLDSVDPKLAVRIVMQLSFSSSRADLRAEMPPPDALVELRKHLKETVMWLHDWSDAVSPAADATVTSAPPAGPTPSSAPPAKSVASRGQRDNALAAATMEDALHTESARLSRFDYLRNPQHLYFPSLDPVENGDIGQMMASTTIPAASSLMHKAKHDPSANGASAGHLTPANGGSQSSRGHRSEPNLSSTGAPVTATDELAAPSTVVMVKQDLPHTRFRYAAPLQPSQYRIELLPLRSWEEFLPIAGCGKDGSPSVAAPLTALTKSGKRQKTPNLSPAPVTPPTKVHNTSTTPVASGSNRPSLENALNNYSSSSSAASTLLCPLTAAECEALLQPTRKQLADVSENWEVTHTNDRALRNDVQSQFRRNFHAYFEALEELKAKRSDIPGDGSSIPPPVPYHSLLGSKDEELGSALKTKKSFAVT